MTAGACTPPSLKATVFAHTPVCACNTTESPMQFSFPIPACAYIHLRRARCVMLMPRPSTYMTAPATSAWSNAPNNHHVEPESCLQQRTATSALPLARAVQSAPAAQTWALCLNTVQVIRLRL